MGERVTKVENMIKQFDKDKKKINSKYNNTRNLNKLKDLEVEINRSNLHIERLKYELSQVPQNEKELIDEYKRQIDIAENGEERQNLLKQKLELNTKININKEESDKKIKDEVFDLENKLRADLTQEGIAIDHEIEKVKFSMQRVLLDMHEFEYRYEEKGGTRIPTNGEDYKALDNEYKEYQNQLDDLRSARKLCDSKLEEFRQKDNEKVSKILNELNKGRDKSEQEKNQMQQENQEQKAMPQEIQPQAQQQTKQSTI